MNAFYYKVYHENFSLNAEAFNYEGSPVQRLVKLGEFDEALELYRKTIHLFIDKRCNEFRQIRDFEEMLRLYKETGFLVIRRYL